MPSLFEGLPVVGIEAQFSGLPCVFSDRITDEVKLIDDCKFISLNQSTSDWAKVILEKRQSKRSISNDLIESKYDIRNSCSNLASFYLEVALNN